MGTCGQDIPFETQFLLVEAQSGSHFDDGSPGDVSNESSLYAVFLPILEGDFRAVLQGNELNELEICLESGKSEKVEKKAFIYCIINSVWLICVRMIIILAASQEILLSMNLGVVT